MAVYERNYRLWTGEATPTWSRFTILPRYAVREIFKSRLLLSYFVLCFVPPLFCAFFVYLANNLDFLQAFPQADLSEFINIDAEFILWLMRVQYWASLFLAIFVGPGLVSRDLANNGLPLILSRPFSRTEYVLGKMAVLCTLVGAVAWLAPNLVLALHVNFQGLSWLGDNSRIAFGTLVAPLLWVVSISLFALAMSAWVRWKAIAGFGMLFVVLAGFFFGYMIMGLFNTPYGAMVNVIWVVDRVGSSFMGGEALSRLPVTGAWISLVGFLVISLFLLERKLRAYQVVR